MDMEFQEACEDLRLFNEALYHISNDYFLSHYLQWSLIVPQPIDNPFKATLNCGKWDWILNFQKKTKWY